MALDKPALISGIVVLQEKMATKTEPDYEYYATELAKLIDAFVKSATVTVPMGIAVTTAGTAVAQTGATTAPGTGTIS